MTELRGRTTRWESAASGGAMEVKGCTRLSGSWWKRISASREIRTVMGSFDSVRLAPHCAQDDRQLKLGSRLQTIKTCGGG